MSGHFTVGQVAKQAGVNLQTVLYYERRGLMSARRAESGYRIFGPDAVRMIRFIKNAQALGFTLEEIKGLLRLRVGQSARCVEVRQRAERHMRGVEAKIKALTAMRAALSRLVTSCRRRKTTPWCPILEALETKGGAYVRH